MTVFYSKITRDPDDQSFREMVDSTYKGARKRVSIAHVTLPATNPQIGDTALLVRLPSHCVLLPSSMIHHPAIAGATDCDVGAANNPDRLVDGQSLITAGDRKIIQVPTRDEFNKRLWDLLGYTTDPGGLIDISLTFNAAGTSGAIREFTAIFEYTLD